MATHTSILAWEIPWIDLIIYKLQLLVFGGQDFIKFFTCTFHMDP